MPDERVSILGVLQDQISAPMAKMAQSADKVAESVKKADVALDAMASSADGVDKAQIQMIGRSTRLIQRLLGIQQAIQTLTSLAPGGFGKFQQTLDASSTALSAFSSIVAIFPNKIGLIVGAAAAAGSALAVVAKNAFEAERRLAELKEELARDREALLEARAAPLLEALIGGDSKLFEAERGLANVRAQIAAVAKEAQAAADKLSTARERGDELAINRAEFEFDNVKKRAVDLAKTYADLKKEVDKLNLVKALQKFKADTEAALSEIDTRVQLGLLSPLEALNEKARLADSALNLLFEKDRQFPGQFTDAIQSVAGDLLGIRKEAADLAAFQASQKALFGKGVPSPDEPPPAPGPFIKGFLEATDHLNTMNGLARELGHELALGVGAFTDTLIDGLITGNFALKDFARDFLIAIAKMIAQALVLQAIMAGLRGLGIIPLNSGGQVPTGDAVPQTSGQTLFAATGGTVPGPNVDRDVVPAMLTPGEYVIRKSAVEHYGVGVMEALNRQLLDASGLRGHTAPRIHKTERFYAGGGEVSSNQSPAAPTPVFAIIPPTEQNMERMLNGGAPAVFQFFQRNKDTIRSILQSRSGGRS